MKNMFSFALVLGSFLVTGITYPAQAQQLPIRHDDFIGEEGRQCVIADSPTQIIPTDSAAGFDEISIIYCNCNWHAPLLQGVGIWECNPLTFQLTSSFSF